MKPSAKRNADKTGKDAPVSPEPKRPNTAPATAGDKPRTLAERRMDQEKRLKEFRENKKKKMEQKKARPVWKPAGPARVVTRSMSKQKSANNIQSSRSQSEPEEKKVQAIPSNSHSV